VLAAGLLAFVVPQVAIDVWPWQLTPLTARVLAGLTVQVGVAALILSGDPRWSAWRLIVQTFLVATALLLIGAVRAFGDFDTSNPLTWLYLGGLLGTAGALTLLHQRMQAAIESVQSTQEVQGGPRPSRFVRRGHARPDAGDAGRDARRSTAGRGPREGDHRPPRP
jgi:hypothetical protein